MLKFQMTTILKSENSLIKIFIDHVTGDLRTGPMSYLE